MGDPDRSAAFIELPEDERQREILAVVRSAAARVLRRTSPADVAVDRVLEEEGLTSLDAVELCDRISNELGVVLEPLAAFDHPTPAALARYAGTLLPAARGEAVPESVDEGGETAPSDAEALFRTIDAGYEDDAPGSR